MSDRDVAHNKAPDCEEDTGKHALSLSVASTHMNKTPLCRNRLCASRTLAPGLLNDESASGRF